MNLQDVFTIIGVTVLIVGLIAGIRGFRPAVARALADAQRQVIETQNLQIDSQEARLKSCEEESTRLKGEITRLKKEVYGVRYAMKDLGYFITLEDDAVSVYDVSTRQQHTTPLRPLHRLATSIVPSEDEDDTALSAS